MLLSDLLVSYKQVNAPSRPIPSIPLVDNTYESSTLETPVLEEKVELPVTTEFVISTAPGFVPTPRGKQSTRWTSPYTDRNKWVSELSAAYRKAGVTNDNALRMLIAQDALESNWGRSALGRFNFGNLTTGSSWKGDYVSGNDHNAAGKPIKLKFRSYNSMDEYAADKLLFLKRLYDFDENDDIAKFTAKLSGANRGKRRYAESRSYATSLTKVFNGFRNG